MTRKIEIPDPDDVIKEYLAGDTLAVIGSRRGMGAAPIHRFIRQQGIKRN